MAAPCKVTVSPEAVVEIVQITTLVEGKSDARIVDNPEIGARAGGNRRNRTETMVVASARHRRKVARCQLFLRTGRS